MESSSNNTRTLARARITNTKNPIMRIRRKYLMKFNNSDILERLTGGSLSIQLIGTAGAFLLVMQ
jgi:hypothetical protein